MLSLASICLHDEGTLPDAAAQTLAELLQKHRTAESVIAVAFSRKDSSGRSLYSVRAANPVQGEQSWEVQVYPDCYIFSMHFGTGGWNGELDGHDAFLAHLHSCGYL